MKYKLPNIFSWSRVVLAPFFVLCFLSEDAALIVASVFIFLLAAITDYFDGWIARRIQRSTAWGVFLDPLADKVLVSAAFLAFTLRDLVPLWMVLVLIARDTFITLLRLYADSVKQPVVTKRSAKVKTFLQMAFIAYILLLLMVQYTAGDAWAAVSRAALHPDILYYTMLSITIVTVWTGTEYAIDNRRLLARFLGVPI